MKNRRLLSNETHSNIKSGQRDLLKNRSLGLILKNLRYIFRSSNFYFWLLLAFVCMSTLPVGYVIAYKRPSKNCGPFSGQERFYSIIGQVLRQHLPKSLVEVISYFMSPGIIFPVSLLLNGQ